MPQRLYIDHQFLGYVKCYYRNLARSSWIFELDTIDSESGRYSLQVEVKFSAIRMFSPHKDIEILTKEADES